MNIQGEYSQIDGKQRGSSCFDEQKSLVKK